MTVQQTILVIQSNSEVFTWSHTNILVIPKIKECKYIFICIHSLRNKFGNSVGNKPLALFALQICP